MSDTADSATVSNIDIPRGEGVVDVTVSFDGADGRERVVTDRLADGGHALVWTAETFEELTDEQALTVRDQLREHGYNVHHDE
jgi:hypothetical protein